MFEWKIKLIAAKVEIKTVAKGELKAEEDKTVKKETRDLSYFLGKISSGDDGSENMFVYQPAFITLEIKVN